MQHIYNVVRTIFYVGLTLCGMLASAVSLYFFMSDLYYLQLGMLSPSLQFWQMMGNNVEWGLIADFCQICIGFALAYLGADELGRPPLRFRR